MNIQINQKFVKANTEMKVSGTILSITPPLDDDYWMLRVPLSENQAVVAFPKFFTMGIGFQMEDDWNTNLPYRCDIDEIFNHIAHNKGDDSISDDDCRKAIGLIKETIGQMKASGELKVL